MTIQLNDQQRDAVDEMLTFAESEESYFMLEGRAGTGKSTSAQTFCRETRQSVVMTAPTNKATKVLKQMCETELQGMVPTRTIYSLLGLRMDNSGEVKQVRAAEGFNQASAYNVVIVDEGSMANNGLMYHIERTARTEGVKFLFMADRTQLPPVGEEQSPVFDIGYRRELTKVERHDNQILAMATHMRECILHGVSLNLFSANDEKGGVYLLNYKKLRAKAVDAFTSDSYAKDPGSIKVIAWRNDTVAMYNGMIREAMYGAKLAAEAPFQPGERVVVCQPIMSPDGKETLMTTDEEGTVFSIDVQQHPVFSELTCYRVEVQPELEAHMLVTCWVIHESSERAHKRLLIDLSNNAKAGGGWPAFWKAKEAIHDVRPSHAITAHRAQGSTYESVFVDSADILLNKNYLESLQCLNVACTRPRRILAISK
jgi:exodeoxyribonuclease-5